MQLFLIILLSVHSSSSVHFTPAFYADLDGQQYSAQVSDGPESFVRFHKCPQLAQRRFRSAPSWPEGIQSSFLIQCSFVATPARSGSEGRAGRGDGGAEAVEGSRLSIPHQG